VITGDNLKLSLYRKSFSVQEAPSVRTVIRLIGYALLSISLIFLITSINNLYNVSNFNDTEIKISKAKKVLRLLTFFILNTNEMFINKKFVGIMKSFIIYI
jgi:hypothetical protein